VDIFLYVPLPLEPEFKSVSSLATLLYIPGSEPMSKAGCRRKIILALPPLTSASPGWDPSQALRNASDKGSQGFSDSDESETEIYLTKLTSNIWSVPWKIGRVGETEG